MVMHARKIPRISDGFSEKHQTHGYENSKYSKPYRYGNHEKSRDSPSTNSLRSSSPDSHSQSPRYHKNYYKIRENRDREREREREYKDYRERDNSRSPKERRRDIRDREHREHRDSRGLHERINSVHKKEEKERLMRIGDWSEHVSSSGKKYYYNCRTEVSQWEKPPEWLEWERSHRGSGSMVNHRSSSSSLGSGTNHLCKDASMSLGLHRSHHDKIRQDRHSSSSDGYRDPRDMERDRREYRNDSHFDHRRDPKKYNQEIGSADMDISSGDSTPTSESLHNKTTIDGDHSSGAHHLGPFSKPVKTSSITLSGPPSASLASSLPGAVSSSSNSLSVNNSHHLSMSSLISGSTSVMMSAVPQLLNSHPRLMSLSSSSCDVTKGHLGHLGFSGHSQDNIDGLGPSSNKSHLEPLSIAANSNNIGPGPPTPTHSENQDGLDIRKIGSPNNSSLNSLQSLSQQVSTSSLELTPSLGNYYKETLISHVQNWPAENFERQCQRLSEEAHTISSLIMTKVSADLKMARSLVRLAEIQATLHEQRILFLRAQKRELEEIKSKNCFMNES